MRILKTDTDNQREQIQNDRDFISSVLDEIFLICREDKNFLKVRKNVETVDAEMKTILEKLETQNSLLNRSITLKNDILKKLSILDNENENMKIELLKKLGSELWEF